MIRGLAVLLIAALSGCAFLKPAPPPAPKQSLDAAFRITGRFAVRAGEEGGSGRIEWQHSADADDLSVLSPIGTGIVRIVRENGIYTLTTRDEKVERATDPEELLGRALGWRLPLAGLPYWIRARAAPDLEPAKTVERGLRVAELRQGGWTIEYLSYHADSGLPERLRLSREKFDLRLVIEEWMQVSVSSTAQGSAQIFAPVPTQVPTRVPAFAKP